jgi:hypothetical protein
VRDVAQHIREAVPDPSRVTLFAGDDPEPGIWAACEQYALPGQPQRLVVVHDAQNLKRVDRLAEVAAALPSLGGVHLLFVAPGSDPPAELQSVSSAQVIRCSLPADEDRAAAERTAWARERLPGIKDSELHELLAAAVDDLSAVAAVCAKVTACGFTYAQAPALAAWQAPKEFADCVLAGERKAALRAAAELPAARAGAVIGQLSTGLTQLGTLYRALDSGKTGRDLHQLPGVPAPVLRKFRSVAGGYSPRQVQSRRQLLDIADSAWRGGARVGVLEMLCANW